MADVTTVAPVDSYGTLDESSLPVLVEELNTSEVDNPYLCVLHAVYELLGLLGHRCHQHKSTKDSCPHQTLLDVQLHSREALLLVF